MSPHHSPEVIDLATLSAASIVGQTFDPLSVPEAPAATPAELQQPAQDDYSSEEFDFTADIPEDVYLFEQRTPGAQIGFFPLGNLSAIKAQAKSGKTFFGSMLMTAALGTPIMDISCRFPSIRVLYVDTEQSKFNVKQVCRRVSALTGKPLENLRENFNVLFMRETSKDDRYAKIAKKIRDWQPTFVFLDGLRDLINDINSNQECSDMIEQLMKLSSEQNCCICCVLHENPGSNKMRGHVGTELLNKVTDVIQLVRERIEGSEDYIFKVVETDSRQRPIRDAAFQIKDAIAGVPALPVAIPSKYNFTNISATTSTSKKGKQPLPTSNRTALLTIVSNIREGVTYSALWEYIYDNYKCTQKEAQTIVKEGYDQGIIYKSNTTKLIHLGPPPNELELNLAVSDSDLATVTNTTTYAPLPLSPPPLGNALF